MNPAATFLSALILIAQYAGGDGSSCEQAVVPLADEGRGMVQAEYQWLSRKFGGGSLVRQALGASSDGKHRYDLILWRTPEGKEVEVCFDVTTVFEDKIREIENDDSRRPAR